MIGFTQNIETNKKKSRIMNKHVHVNVNVYLIIFQGTVS